MSALGVEASCVTTLANTSNHQEPLQPHERAEFAEFQRKMYFDALAPGMSTVIKDTRIGILSNSFISRLSTIWMKHLVMFVIHVSSRKLEEDRRVQ